MSLLSAYLQGGIPGLVQEFVYHRWYEDAPTVVKKPTEISIPRVDDGSPVPIIYGRCRVRQPICVWHDAPERDTGNGVGNGWPVGVDFYRMDMFMVLGYGFDGGTNLIHGMFAGEKAFDWQTPSTAETALQAEINTTAGIDQGIIGGFAFYYDGDSAQDVETTFGGITMIAAGTSADNIPSYRGMLSTLLYNSGGQWILGTGNTVPAYSFEASSYKDTAMPAVGIYARIGTDSNPMNALYDLLLKIGVPAANIDMTSFDAAATTLYNEGNGYSRCIEDRKAAGEYIIEIMRQVDGAFFYDETSGTFKVKLVRDDYVPADLPQITKDNCKGLINFASGSWYNLPNKIKLIYENGADGFRDGSATVRNQANSVGQDGIQIEHMIEMRGVTNADNAARLAGRELAALSMPLMKGRAIMDRSAVRWNPGDAVRVTMSNPDVAGIVFRVAAVDRGTLENGQIALDLIQDVNYNFRGRVPEPPALIDTGIIRGGLVGGLG